MGHVVNTKFEHYHDWHVVSTTRKITSNSAIASLLPDHSGTATVHKGRATVQEFTSHTFFVDAVN